MATERKASVTWQGDLMSGHGTIESVTSGVLGPLEVDWANRAEDAQGKTSPEELIAAAHAACFAMALSNGLAKDGHAPERLETSATVTFVPGTGITKSACCGCPGCSTTFCTSSGCPVRPVKRTLRSCLAAPTQRRPLGRTCPFRPSSLAGSKARGSSRAAKAATARCSA